MNFFELINETYYYILGTNDSMCKIDNIKRCKYFLGLKEEDYLGDYYYKNISFKNKGVIYTPENISYYMAENTIGKDIINNPYIKIIDPSCGCGHIILSVFKYLKKTYLENLAEVNRDNNLELTEQTVGEHIVKYNLFGIDIDNTALKILVIDMYYNTGYVSVENFNCMDFLIEPLEMKFDIVIGNPPYVGTKTLEKNYSSILRGLYSEVFSDKGDISYCFFQKVLRIVEDNYKITFITSRYFMEALSGENLREFILNNSNIYKIVDFYGDRPFKNAGIDPVIIFLSNVMVENFEVKKPGENVRKRNNKDISNFDTIFVKSSGLNIDPWRLQEGIALEIIRKIEKKCTKRLEDICNSYQGIITGLDKAFVLNSKDVEEYKIEKPLVKPWIKSSNITRNGVAKNNLYLIYADLIKNEEQYPNAFNYISKYKDKLSLRRECRVGRRPWYGLQWGREESLFESKKIIFPYKSADNRFEIDKGNYFSADVYSLVIKDEMDVDYGQLKLILNSSLYEFYFKCFAKKLGGKLYEYYPNNLKRLYIPLQRESKIHSEFDLYKYFSLSDKEVDYIGNKRG